MPLFIGIVAFGIGGVSRGFVKLTLAPAIRRVVHPALRDAALRLRTKIAEAAPVLTGKLRQQLLRSSVKLLDHFGVGRVTFEQILPDGHVDETFLQKLFSLEYGSAERGIAPLGFFRRTVDEHRDQEVQRISEEMARDFEHEWAKVFNR